MLCRTSFLFCLLLGFTAWPANLGAQDRGAAPQEKKQDKEQDKKQEEVQDNDVAAKSSSDDERRKVRYEKFREMMSGVRLVGRFTIIGKADQSPHQEEYEIRSVTKLPTGDLWLFNARIKYGDHDVTLPMPLEVKWAEETPIITLDNVTIPTLGTFGARVVLHDQKYAGTWSHGEVGGHLFGTIEKIKQPTND